MLALVCLRPCIVFLAYLSGIETVFPLLRIIALPCVFLAYLSGIETRMEYCNETV